MTTSNLTSHQKRGLLVLTLLNFVNWVDRQIVLPLFPLIKADFQVSYSQLGWLVAAFSLVHSFGSLVLGRLADLTSRKKVISYGILFWSGATFLSGLASSFRSLVTARALVGVGEAAYTPAANAIISGSFSQSIRARVQGVFDLGMFVGGAVGVAMGAIMAQSVGWRPAFFIVGVPGLILAFAVAHLPEAPHAPSEERIPMGDLLRVPAYVMVLVSGWFVVFAGHSYVIWGTEFVYRYKGFTLRQAGTMLGSVMVVGGILGVMTGAALADRLAKAYPWGRALIPALGFLTAAPFLFGAIHASTQWGVLRFFFAGSFFMTWYHGPLTAIIHDLTPPRAHATALGIYYFFVNLFATTAASLLVGKIADRYGLTAGMHAALASQIIGGLGFFGVIYFIRRHGLQHAALAQYQTPAGVPTALAVPASEERD